MGSNLGRALAGGVDVDNDGFNDLLIGSEFYDIGANADQGKVFVVPDFGIIEADDFESNDLLRWTTAIP